jgi:hypothetical protein
MMSTATSWGEHTPLVLSRLTRVAIEVQKVLVGDYSPDYSADKQKTNYIRSAHCLNDNCQPDPGPVESQCREELSCNNICPVTYSSLGNGAGFSPTCMERDVVDIMVGAFGLPRGTDVFTEAWEQENCGFKCTELHRAEKIVQFVIAVATELSSCPDATDFLNPQDSTHPAANSKRDLAQKFVYGRMASVMVMHSDRGIPIDLNDAKILEELFLYKTPCDLLRQELGVDVLLTAECGNHQRNSARYNCPAYLTCGAPGSCAARPILPALRVLAGLNRAVHNADMDNQQELDDLDEQLEALLERIRRDGNECSPSPCGPNGACIDGLYEYSCLCSPGFTGVDCRAPQDTVTQVDGFVDYSNAPINCVVYSQHEFYSVSSGDRVWDDGTAPGREAGYYLTFDLKYAVGPVNADRAWPYSHSIMRSQPQSVLVSEPQQQGAVCPLMVTRVDKSSANRLTTLTEFLKLEENRGHEDATAAVRAGFHLDRSVDYYDHAALYGQDADCEQTRNVFRALLKIDLLVESAVALSTQPLSAEALAYYEIADLVSDGDLDLTGSRGAYPVNYACNIYT